MRLQGVVFRLLTLGSCAIYIWVKNPLLIFPALMALLTSHAYYRLKNEMNPDIGAESHE